MYRAYTMGTAAAFGFLSLRYRKGVWGGQGPEMHAARENSVVMHALNDAIAGLLGYFLGHLLCCDYVYKHRQYVLQRVYFEGDRGIQDRRSLLRSDGEMLNEYPIRNEEIISDVEIMHSRLDTAEDSDNSRQVRVQQKTNEL